MMNEEKESKYLSILMQRIDKFVRGYGVEELILYLEEYQKDVPLEEFQKYQKIERVSCSVWDLPIADINASNHKSVNKSVRMTIAYLTKKYTKINKEQICLMMKLKLRTVVYYLEEIEYRIENYSQFPLFCENLEIIRNKTDFIY